MKADTPTMTNTLQNEMYADVVIVGAGYAGLNALVSANKYLNADQHALIADIRENFGGHWLEAYDFVHLHQPYQFFTAYDRPWDLHKDRRYLASRLEVLTHFRELGEHEVAEKSTKTLFGHRYIKHELMEDGNMVHVLFQSIENPEISVTVRTPRMINAVPLSIPHKTPLSFSSNYVQSIAPKSLSKVLNVTFGIDDEVQHGGESQNILNNEMEFVIVGSGKTSMDTILFIHRHAPNARITLISGGGTAFINRDLMYSTEFKDEAPDDEATILDIMLTCSLDWDGSNEQDLMDRLLQDNAMISAVPAYSCKVGLLNAAELESVKKAVTNIEKARVLDIVDQVEQDGSISVKGILDNGQAIDLSTVPENGKKNVFVLNCTSHFKPQPAKPILESNGRVLNPQLVLFLPGPTASAMTHAWMLGTLDAVKDNLYGVFVPEENDKKAKGKFFFRTTLAQMYNATVLFSALPETVRESDLTDVMLWHRPERITRAFLRLEEAAAMLKTRCEENLGPDFLYPSSEKAV